VHTSWQHIIQAEKNKTYFKQLMQKLADCDRAGATIHPPKHQQFRAFELCEWLNTKVLILGQDPYHGENQANGLAFSVNPDIAPPPSLKNIFKAINHDFECKHKFTHGCLDSWAKQGVLLLNTILSVEHGQAFSHAAWGWEQFTDCALRELNQHPHSIVYMLWGKSAQKKIQFIDQDKHLVLCAPHPSPLSAYRGFFECQHFSRCNEHLLKQNIKPIHWFF
jgi:uracil-DNA glycosylase